MLALSAGDGDIAGAAHEGFYLTVQVIGAQSRREGRRLVEGDYAVASNGARRFIYEYGGQAKLQDVEDDPTGGMETPIVGSVVNRNGKEWRVVSVLAPVSSRGTASVVRVFLSNHIKGPFFLKRSIP
jgi:hypothetical protein